MVNASNACYLRAPWRMQSFFCIRNALVEEHIGDGGDDDLKIHILFEVVQLDLFFFFFIPKWLGLVGRPLFALRQNGKKVYFVYPADTRALHVGPTHGNSKTSTLSTQRTLYYYYFFCIHSIVCTDWTMGLPLLSARDGSEFSANEARDTLRGGSLFRSFQTLSISTSERLRCDLRDTSDSLPPDESPVPLCVAKVSSMVRPRLMIRSILLYRFFRF